MKERRVLGCQKWRGNTSRRKGEVATVLATEAQTGKETPMAAKTLTERDFLCGDMARKLVITQTLGEK